MQIGCSALMACVICTSVSTATEWEDFLVMPTSNNAAKVSKLEYSRDVDPMEKNMDLDLLETQIAALDSEAIALAFRVLPQLDGAYAETVDIVLGRLIRANAALFLASLRKHRAKVRSLGHLVGNFGPGYVDRMEAHEYERKCRIAALRRVDENDLKEIRDECIQVLEKM